MSDPGATVDATHASGTAAPPCRVLIAEDEVHLGVLLEQFLVGRGHQVSIVRDGRAALDVLRAEPFDVALLDVQMPGLDGLAVLRGVRELPLPPQVVVMTGNGTAETALSAVRAGAYDYVAKPYRMAEIDLLVRRAAERYRLEALAVAAECEEVEPITRYAPLRAVLDAVDAAASSVDGALICGEPGTGRTLLARRIHRAAGGGPFVTLDARASAEERAVARKLAAARGGTLLVRAVDAMPVELQRRVAADGRRRVVATTACAPGDLALDLSLGSRLGAIVVELPALRDRPGDVAALVEAFVRRFGRGSPPVVTAAALDRLERHPWPGNVGELRLVIEAAIARAAGGAIEPAHLRLDAVRPANSAHLASAP
jgi:DNA-binding NtrC family response regulator